MKARWYPLHALPHKLQHAWVHPEHGFYFSSITGSHAKDANELGFKGEYGQEARENAMRSGLVRYYKIPSAEVGVEFDPQHKGAAEMAKKLVARHAIPGKHILAEVPGDYYHGTSLKDAHDFIDRVSSGRKETDYARMKRELGEATLLPHSDNRPGRARYDIEHEGKRIGNLAVLHVDRAPGLPAGSKAGKLGVRLNPEARGSRALVRDVLRQLRDRHPDLTHVGGLRLSGTRARADDHTKSVADNYTWIKLRRAIR